MKTLTKNIYIILIIILFLSGCRDRLEIFDDTVDPNLQELMRGNDLRLIESAFILHLNEKGEIYQPYRSYQIYGWSGQVFNSGLWMSGYQGGELKANLVGINKNEITSNFQPVDNTSGGQVFYFIPSLLQTHLSNWPENAPRDETGEFIVYGDEMCWVNLKSMNLDGAEIYGHPFSGIDISQSMFSINHSSLANTVFIRYEISNKSNEELRDLYLGFYVDADIRFGMSDGDFVGYDSLWQISYTYTRSEDPSTGKYFALGNIILQTPDNSGENVRVVSHRLITKDDSTDFDESALSLNGVYYALQGLSNSGQNMINPVSGEITKYALTGDPVFAEGWIDSQRDARSLISTGPFNITNNSSRHFTAALFVTSATSFESLINQMRIKASKIILNKLLWE